MILKFNRNLGFTIDPLKNELYILHRQFPACLIHVIRDIPVRFIIEDLYDEVENPADLLTMSFVNEAKEYFRQFGGIIMGGN